MLSKFDYFIVWMQSIQLLLIQFNSTECSGMIEYEYSQFIIALKFCDCDQ